MTEVDLQTGIEPELHVLGHLNALVPGQGPPKLFGEVVIVSRSRHERRSTSTRERRAALRSWAVVTLDRREMSSIVGPA